MIIKTRYFYFLFILIMLILPSIILEFFNTSSYADGLSVVMIIVLVGCYRHISRIKFLSKKLWLTYLVFLGYLLIQGLFGFAPTTKGLLSVVLLGMMVLTAYFSVAWLTNTVDNDVKKHVCGLYVFVLIVGLVNVSLIQDNTSIFPFGEFSHYGLILGSFSIAVYHFTYSIYKKNLITFLLLLIGLSGPNLTTLVFVPILISFQLSARRMINVCLLLALIIYLALHVQYIKSRLGFDVNETSNLSTLVYLQGWDFAQEGLYKSDGLGIGFQNLGTTITLKSQASVKIMSMMHSSHPLNFNDGGFLASKIISELGIFGIILLIMYVALCYKSFFILRNKKANLTKKEIWAYSTIIGFSVEVFIRGMGYFSVGVFLFLIALLYIWCSIKLEKYALLNAVKY